MADTISFRPTAHDRAVLARLGENPTDAIRSALAIALKSLTDDDLRREALRLAADPQERAESESLAAFMGDTFEDLPE